MTSDIHGHWHGVLDTGAVKVKLGFRLDGDTAWLDTRAAGVLELPLARDGQRVAFGSVPFDVVLDLQRVGERLEGTCFHNAVDFPVSFAPGLAPPAVHAARPQTPAPPFPYETETVTITGADGSRLSGTLTRPSGPGPYPAIVLSSWFGQTDRDQMVAGHRPFALWADELTRRGFTTLRYDKRGVGASEGRFDTATTADFAADLACAVAILRNRTDIGAVGLLGHSEGGHISADLAAADPTIAFCVMMTPTGVPDELILEAEMFNAARVVGGVPRDFDRTVRFVRALSEASKAPTAGETVALAREILAAEAYPPERLDSRAAIAASPWRRYWATYDHTAGLRGLTCPALVVFAGMDLQTPPRAHAAKIMAANPSANVVTLPGLNHFLQPAITGAPSEYGEIETTLDPSVIKAVCDWIVEVGRP
ncbi:S9 family peptidase [Phenylobacterium sp.]|uniref:alpha/beta hydrolase family protein n=1 Tax=Phenylobacterium sp. TaxID=1871053 RepID=UPI0027353CBD|nr:alpha/beta fold hydrolase [Phenylobacterium sp.]MDP3633456.1 alpha/beta fold hydrolase [Phenylobacterium sp.]